MRLAISGLACLLLCGCVTTGGQDSKLASSVTADPTRYDDKAVVTSTMEVRVDTSAVGGISPDEVGDRLALALATITEFRPETGTAVTPIISAVTLPDNQGRMTRRTEYAPNAFRQTAWMDDYDKVLFERRSVDPGWYIVHSFGSTAGFEMLKPRTGQKGCLLPGAVPAPGVQPVALNAGEVGYFGHFVITIAVEPGDRPDRKYALSVADAAIEAAPADLDDLLRRDGLDPTHVHRIAADRFPCPWTVPRQATS